jgi:Domain of Unknown Function (DUF1080)
MRWRLTTLVAMSVGIGVGFVWGAHWASMQPRLIWTVEYDGYGQVESDNGWLTLAPRPAVDANETHAALVLAGDPSWRDYEFQVRMRIDQQLRENSKPNPWEAGWLFFRYTSPQQAYYLAHKTNGLELGKLVPANQDVTQVFLATTDQPVAELGRWYHYRVVVQGSMVSVYVDGVLRISYTDPDPILMGRVGLYTEDAHTSFDQPAIRLAN